jgi:hypothetical protein
LWHSHDAASRSSVDSIAATGRATYPDASMVCGPRDPVRKSSGLTTRAQKAKGARRIRAPFVHSNAGDRYEVVFIVQLLSLQHEELSHALPCACFIVQLCVPSAAFVQQFSSLQQALSVFLQHSALASLQQSAPSLQQLFSIFAHE